MTWHQFNKSLTTILLPAFQSFVQAVRFPGIADGLQKNPETRFWRPRRSCVGRQQVRALRGGLQRVHGQRRLGLQRRGQVARPCSHGNHCLQDSGFNLHYGYKKRMLYQNSKSAWLYVCLVSLSLSALLMYLPPLFFIFQFISLNIFLKISFCLVHFLSFTFNLALSLLISLLISVSLLFQFTSSSISLFLLQSLSLFLLQYLSLFLFSSMSLFLFQFYSLPSISLSTLSVSPWTNFGLQDEPWAEFSTLEVAACIILCTYSPV